MNTKVHCSSLVFIMMGIDILDFMDATAEVKVEGVIDCGALNWARDIGC